MNDSEPEVRQMAAFALGLIGDARAVERLLAALAGPEPVVRARAAEALGRHRRRRARRPSWRARPARRCPRTRPLVTVRGDDPGSATRPLAGAAPRRCSRWPASRTRAAAESVLLDGGRPRFDWWAATWTAMRLESPALRAGAGGRRAPRTDPLSRALAARGPGRAQGRRGRRDARCRSLRDKDAQVVVVRRCARWARSATRAACPRWPRRCARRAQLVLRAEALRALAALPPDRGAARARWSRWSAHEDPGVRAAALPALARSTARSSRSCSPAWTPIPVWSVRAGLAGALADAGDEVSAGILLAMLKDDDVRVLPAVLEALRKARGADAVDTLRRHLEHADFARARGGGRGAGRAQGRAGISAALVGRLDARRCGDADLDARLAVVDALARAEGRARPRAALREIAAERSRAGGARARGRGRAARAGPAGARRRAREPVDRPPLDYREAMAPYDPRPGVRALHAARDPAHAPRPRSRSTSTSWRRR